MFLSSARRDLSIGEVSFLLKNFFFLHIFRGRSGCLTEGLSDPRLGPKKGCLTERCLTEGCLTELPEHPGEWI
jgi:hypothetical protein